MGITDDDDIEKPKRSTENNSSASRKNRIATYAKIYDAYELAEKYVDLQIAYQKLKNDKSNR